MGNGARAQQKRERNADKGPKAAASQLKAVSFQPLCFTCSSYRRYVVILFLLGLWLAFGVLRIPISCRSFLCGIVFCWTVNMSIQLSILIQCTWYWIYRLRCICIGTYRQFEQSRNPPG